MTSRRAQTTHTATLRTYLCCKFKFALEKYDIYLLVVSNSVDGYKVNKYQTIQLILPKTLNQGVTLVYL